MTPYEEWGLWVYRERRTSDVGGTTGITWDLSAGTGNVIHVLEVRASAVIAATGTLDITLIDEDAAVIVRFADLAAAASPQATIPRLNDDIISSTSADEVSSVGGVWLAGADVRLRVEPGNLAAADTVDFQIVARVMNGPGTLAFAAGAGTAASSITQNEVF